MPKTVFIVPHFHYDAAWLDTYEGYLELCHRHILDVLNIMRQDPEYKFVLDQVALIRPFMERYPEQAAYLRQVVQEGRLELVCGMFAMPDANMPCGESLLRQILVGKRYCRETFGVDVRVGWMVDVFGNHPQLPQLFAKAGFEWYVFGRVMQPGSPSEFRWRGIDGTELICHWMPHHYVLFYPAPATEPEFERFVDERLGLMRPHATGDTILMLNGMDFAPPQRHVPALVRAFNERRDDVQLRISTPSEFFRALEKRRLKTIEGDFNAIFQGCYSARIRVKQASRAAETTLLQAERFQAAARALAGATARPGTAELDRAWEQTLLAQFHDVICGCHINAVFEETMRDLDEAQRAGQGHLHDALDAIASRITATDAPCSLAVFNPLPWRRTDVAEATVGISAAGVHDIALEDANGQRVPLQMLAVERYGDGGVKKARFAFIAHDVPGVGYKTYRLAHSPEGPPPEPGALTATSGRADDPLAPHTSIVEHEHWRLTFHAWTGCITSLVDKHSGAEFIDPERPWGNTITREPDHGDLWEYNARCRGGSTVPTHRVAPFPAPHEADFSHNCGGAGHATAGPVFAEFAIASAFGAGHRSQRVRIYRGLRRIDFRTAITNNDEWVRYRVAFPTVFTDARPVREIPFGAVAQPEGEYPAQNWIDLPSAGGERGIALLNRGLPGNNVTDGVLMLSLLKCTMIPGQPTDGAFEKGIEHVFEYALLPHDGDWRAAEVYRAGLELNYPLTVRKVAAGSGELPGELGLLEASPANVIVSHMQTADERILVRIYEASGERSRGTLTFGRPIRAASLADCLGRPRRGKAYFERNELRFYLKPFQVRTLLVELS